MKRGVQIILISHMIVCLLKIANISNLQAIQTNKRIISLKLWKCFLRRPGAFRNLKIRSAFPVTSFFTLFKWILLLTESSKSLAQKINWARICFKGQQETRKRGNHPRPKPRGIPDHQPFPFPPVIFPLLPQPLYGLLMEHSCPPG